MASKHIEPKSRVEVVARDLDHVRRNIKSFTTQIDITQVALHQLQTKRADLNNSYQALLRELDKSSSLSA